MQNEVLQLLGLKNIIKYLFSFLCIAAFLAVTSGFTVYTHYCNDTEIKQHSIVSNVTCQHNHDISKSHNIHDILSSCNEDCNIESESNECCTDEKQYYKISDMFILPSVIVEDSYISSYAIIISLDNLNADKFYKESEPAFSLPPPLSGKQIVLLYQQLKTSPIPLLV